VLMFAGHKLGLQDLGNRRIPWKGMSNRPQGSDVHRLWIWWAPNSLVSERWVGADTSLRSFGFRTAVVSCHGLGSGLQLWFAFVDGTGMG
jgi:hypothetical protein